MVSELYASWVSFLMESNKSKEGSYGLSYPMLIRANYTVRAIKMKVIMQAYGVWEAIEPKDPKAVVEEKMDKQALTIIYQAIPDDTLLAVDEKKSCKEAWTALKTLSKGADKVKQVKAQTLKAEFEALKMKDTEHIDDFCMRLNGLVANIRSLGEVIGETYVVKKLLRAVPTGFLQIASAIEQFENLDNMSVEEVMGSLKAHEERVQGRSETSEGQQLLMIEEEWKSRENKDSKFLLTREGWLKQSGKNVSPGGSDYRVRDSRIVRDRSQVKCFNCGGYGHFVIECRKPRKFRPQKGKGEPDPVKLNDDEPALLMVMCETNAYEVILLTENEN
ncbi:uncharacterized protein LOC141665139 [Apium graveolens]|uniref:uncharacterized protein LOC141665139 n=1 Tax=Apium graveolens TaxID=4045 RepID=UPI003D7BF739